MMALETIDWKGLAWLCEMAAKACLYEEKYTWANSLFQDAERFRERAEDARRAQAVRQIAVRRAGQA